jgi:hypothetical protein
MNSTDINNVNEFPIFHDKNFRIILKDYNNNVSEDIKKYLLISLLNEEVIIPGAAKMKINMLINIILKIYISSFIIYPFELNVIHFILFNNLDINKLLNIIIIIFNRNEENLGSMTIKDQHFGYNTVENYMVKYQVSYHLSIGTKVKEDRLGIKNIFNPQDKHGKELNKLIYEMYNSVNTNIININFNREYEKLIFNNINHNETNIDNLILEINQLKDEINNSNYNNNKSILCLLLVIFSIIFSNIGCILLLYLN